MTSLINKVLDVSEQYPDAPLWFTPEGELHSGIYVIFASILYYLLGYTWLENDFTTCIDKLQQEVSTIRANDPRITNLANRLILHRDKHIPHSDPKYVECNKPITEILHSLNALSSPANSQEQSSISSWLQNINPYVTSRDPAGLDNLSLTCFANASFQAIRRSSFFLGLLQTPLNSNGLKNIDSSMTAEITFKTNRLQQNLLALINGLNLEELLSKNSEKQDPYVIGVKQYLVAIFEDINFLFPKLLGNNNFTAIGRQQDASELLRGLFDLFNINNASKKLYTAASILKGKKGAKDQPLYHVINDGFSLFINAPLPHETTEVQISALLEESFKEETIADMALAKDSRGIEFKPTTKKCILVKEQRAPAEFFLQLNRGTNDLKKNSISVSNWNEPITLSFYPANIFTDYPNPQKIQPEPATYRPVDIVCHHGHSLGETINHYTTYHIYYENPQKPSMKRFNDGKVTEEELLNGQTIKKIANDCYLIRYEQVFTLSSTSPPSTSSPSTQTSSPQLPPSPTNANTPPTSLPQTSSSTASSSNSSTFFLQESPPDGSCLFHSLVTGLNNKKVQPPSGWTQIDLTTSRTKIAEYMTNHNSSDPELSRLINDAIDTDNHSQIQREKNAAQSLQACVNNPTGLSTSTIDSINEAVQSNPNLLQPPPPLQKPSPVEYIKKTKEDSTFFGDEVDIYVLSKIFQNIPFKVFLSKMDTNPDPSKSIENDKIEFQFQYLNGVKTIDANDNQGVALLFWSNKPIGQGKSGIGAHYDNLRYQ